MIWMERRNQFVAFAPFFEVNANCKYASQAEELLIFIMHVDSAVRLLLFPLVCFARVKEASLICLMYICWLDVVVEMIKHKS